MSENTRNLYAGQVVTPSLIRDQLIDRRYGVRGASVDRGVAGVFSKCHLTPDPPTSTALVIEDEVETRRLLKIVLEAEGYCVCEVASGEQGLIQAAQRRPDVVLIGLELPDTDGITVIKRLREWSSVPIVALSVQARENFKIAALDSGADDYLTKPFGTGELMARLRVARRRAKTMPESAIFQNGHVEVDLVARVVKVRGKPVKLTATEYALLQLFMRHAGKVLTHRQILKEVWGPTYREQRNYVRVYMTHLRKQIEEDPSRPELLITETGIGYRLLDNALMPNETAELEAAVSARCVPLLNTGLSPYLRLIC
jgi:two-component system KDP operon response regulator KdpE